MWWYFTTIEQCNAAQSAATALLPHDTELDGSLSVHQVTSQWAIPTKLTDGSFAIPAYTGMPLPNGASEMTDAEVAALIPAAVDD